MFVQVIRGQVADPEQVHAALDRWSQQLAAGAPGWLGSTAGVTEDGRFVALARFESAEAARRNSDRPEQGQWWTETSKLFTGEVMFRDSSDVTADVTGDPDTAGFVQVMQGRSSDPDRARELMAQDPDEWAAFRPDIIRSVAVGHQGGAYTVAMYFTSEQAAREGERKEPPPELKALMEEMNQLMAGEPEFLDPGNPGSTHPEKQTGQARWRRGRRPGLPPERPQPQTHRTILRAQLKRPHRPRGCQSTSQATTPSTGWAHRAGRPYRDDPRAGRNESPGWPPLRSRSARSTERAAPS